MPHEGFLGARLVTKLCLKGANRIIVHGRSEENEVKKLFKIKETTRLFLPLFNFFLSVEKSK
jgi:hypothetical protein